MTASDVAPGTKDTFSTPSLTHETEKSLHETPEPSIRTFVPAHEELEDKKEEIHETLEEDNWESDPENARNWPSFKKWVSMFIVRVVNLFLLTNRFLYDL